ncbi:RING/U-box [Glarea lozoyensis ATCC 20868]|uniref:RING/U-box n=1 Tax=Glarea lozoyensis (strain ATCC 20868 / MF5171) TaxID=1116229 RepID=S3D7E5_GLAL2|nr:RING/U-box [Glarea lozoyensis ATCC 20868]EPE33059.1 RING/U-box [Glarea lozoyensis ATCC 20868]
MSLTSEANGLELDGTTRSDIHSQVEIYEPLMPGREHPGPFNEQLICAICLEPCSQERPMWLMEKCSHELCKHCFSVLILYQHTDDRSSKITGKCPLCREHVDLRLRWSLPPPSKFTVSYNLLGGRYSPKSSLDRCLVGINQDGQGVMVENSSVVEIRQLGDFTETSWKRTMGLTVTSCPTCIESHSLNCTKSQAMCESTRISQVLDSLAAVWERDWISGRLYSTVSFCATKEAQPEAGYEPRMFETLVQKCIHRRRGDTHDPSRQCCNSPSGSTSYEFITWTTKVRERCFSSTLLPTLPLPCDQPEDRKTVYKALVGIQKVLAMNVPEVPGEDLASFLKFKGVRPATTRLALNLQEQFDDVFREVAHETGGVIATIKSYLGVQPPVLDEDLCPLDPLSD